jgi:hypothetical protein
MSASIEGCRHLLNASTLHGTSCKSGARTGEFLGGRAVDGIDSAAGGLNGKTSP